MKRNVIISLAAFLGALLLLSAPAVRAQAKEEAEQPKKVVKADVKQSESNQVEAKTKATKEDASAEGKAKPTAKAAKAEAKDDEDKDDAKAEGKATAKPAVKANKAEAKDEDDKADAKDAAKAKSSKTEAKEEKDAEDAGGKGKNDKAGIEIEIKVKIAGAEQAITVTIPKAAVRNAKKQAKSEKEETTAAKKSKTAAAKTEAPTAKTVVSKTAVIKSGAKAEEAEENEVVVPINDVPAAVRKTLEREAAGQKITTVDKQMKDGKEVFEADVILDGRNYEILVATNGSLISKSLDPETGAAPAKAPAKASGKAEAEAKQPAAKPTLDAGQVPAAVKRTLASKFPDAKDTAWKLKADKNYEAEFMLQGTQIAAKFDPAGKWMETETTISGSEVPKAIQSTVAKQFKGYQVVETQSLKKSGEEPLIYELHLENAKEVVKAQFQADGTILNKSVKAKSNTEE